MNKSKTQFVQQAGQETNSLDVWQRNQMLKDANGPPKDGPEDSTFLQSQAWPNEAMGPPSKTQGNRDKSTSDRYGRAPTTNTTYEKRMRTDGREKFAKSIEAKVTPKGTKVSKSVQDRPAHFNKLNDVSADVAEGLRKDLVNAQTAAGPRPMWVEPLKLVSPETLSYIGLICCFNCVLKNWSLSNLTQKIGEMIEQELLLVELMDDDAKTNKRIIKQVEEAHSSRDVRLKSLRNIVMKNGFRSLRFGVFTDATTKAAMKVRRTLYAAPVLSSVLQYCDVFEKVTEVEGKENTVARIQFTIEAEETLSKSEEHLSWLAPIYKPMLTAPAPWTSFDTGCYDDAFLSSRVSYVRQATAAQKRHIEHQFAQGIPTHARAANALQATPLSINRPMLEVVEWCWQAQMSLGKFPTSSLPPRPRLPEDHESLAPVLKAAIKADIRKHFALERQVKGAAAVMRQDLKTAKELSDHEQFFLPVNLDFRGRLYFVPAFNYHRDDHIKSLFTYQRGYKVDGNNAYWLKVHLANSGDFEKISKQPLDERAAWTEANHDMLLDIAADYQATFELWSQADKPFAYLAAIFEYARLIAEGDDFVGYLPISLDGTNSGVQMYSGINLSSTEGSLVNLVPTNSMADIYKLNADRVIEELKCIKDGSEPFNPKWAQSRTKLQLAQAWLDFGINRSVLKRATMTWAYSSKAVGMAGQYMEDLMKPLQRKVAYGKLKEHPLGDTERAQFEAARFMGQISYDAIKGSLPHVNATMEYLQGVAKVVSEENKPIKWTTPSGFPVVQEYRRKKRREVRIFLFDRSLQKRTRHKVSLAQETSSIDVQKSTNAIAPNFIHGSGDSSHMHLTICHMLDNGLAEDFFMIHDSFSMSGDTWDLFDGVRETFVNMFDGDCILQKFEDEVRQQLSDPNAVLPTMPAKGTLDIQQVKGSEFCFS